MMRTQGYCPILPYTSFETDRNIDYLMANGLRYKYRQVFSFEELINKTLRRNAAYNYAVRNYEKYDIVISQFENVLNLLVGLAFYRHKLGDLYIKEMVRRNILPLVLDLLIVFGFAGILVLIWRHIGFYIEKIKEMIRQSNSQIKVNYMPFAAMLQSTLRIAWILTAFIVAGFVDLILSLRIAKSLSSIVLGD